MKTIKWEDMGFNSILKGDGFYISYNSQVGNVPEHAVLMSLGNMLGGDLKDGEETALYNKKTDKWYILEGDFRKEYEKAFPLYQACKKVYIINKKKENGSNWSTD